MASYEFLDRGCNHQAFLCRYLLQTTFEYSFAILIINLTDVFVSTDCYWLVYNPFEIVYSQNVTVELYVQSYNT